MNYNLFNIKFKRLFKRKEYYLTLSRESQYLTTSDLSKIFSNLKEIYYFHSNELLPCLDVKYSNYFKLLNQKPNQLTICDAFVKYLNKSSLFEVYLNNLKDALILLDSICEQHPLFNLQLENIDQKVS